MLAPVTLHPRDLGGSASFLQKNSAKSKVYMVRNGVSSIIRLDKKNLRKSEVDENE